MSDCHPVEITVVAGGLLVSYLVFICEDVYDSWLFYSKKQSSKQIKNSINGMIKINFPICKMWHTLLNGVRFIS